MHRTKENHWKLPIDQQKHVWVDAEPVNPAKGAIIEVVRYKDGTEESLGRLPVAYADYYKVKVHYHDVLAPPTNDREAERYDVRFPVFVPAV
jgi:hypothetical protein